MTNGPGKSFIIKALLAGSMMVPLSLPAIAAPAKKAAPASTATFPIAADRIAGLPNFIDGVLAHQLIDREVAGAVVVVVYKGRILFSKGYGWADVDRHVPVDPAHTLFRPGSSSKLFTWTALMQLVEQGKVDLDADINTYLDFRIPPRDGKPILVRNLVDHRPGFEDSKRITVDDPKDYIPFSEWMPKNIPDRVFPAGTESAYSNYGAALAGYIVQRVSGMPFEDYVQKNIFRPLGMTQTSFLDPATPARMAARAEGYAFENGHFVKKPMEYYGNIAPAGSAFAPGEDMAKFMIAQLHDGRYGNARILKPATVEAMHRQRSSNVPGFPGIATGFLVQRTSGPQIIGHGGNTTDFHSQLTIVPEADFGFFLSYTGGQGSYVARTELNSALIGRLFPVQPSPRWTGSGGISPVGRYVTNHRLYSRAPTPGNYTRVERAGPHAITIQAGNGPKTYWEQIGADTYEQVTGTSPGGPYNKVGFFMDKGVRRMGYAAPVYALWSLVD